MSTDERRNLLVRLTRLYFDLPIDKAGTFLEIVMSHMTSAQLEAVAREVEQRMAARRKSLQ